MFTVRRILIDCSNLITQFSKAAVELDDDEVLLGGSALPAASKG